MIFACIAEIRLSLGFLLTIFKGSVGTAQEARTRPGHLEMQAQTYLARSITLLVLLTAEHRFQEVVTRQCQKVHHPAWRVPTTPW
jgi:hypothetical protein